MRENMTDKKAAELKRPNDSITVKLNEKNQTYIMTAGLIRWLVKLADPDGLGPQEALQNIFSKSDIQALIISEAIRLRDERGNPVGDESNYNYYNVPLDVEDAHALTKWIGEHIIYFLLKNAESIKQIEHQNHDILKQIQDQATELMQSPTGSVS